MAKRKKRGQWVPSVDKIMSHEEVKHVRDDLRAKAAEDLAKGRRRAIVRWAIVDLALCSGLRVFEITALKIKDLRLAGSTPQITVRRGKGGRARTIPLTGWLAGLKEHLKEFVEWKSRALEPTDPDAPLFASHRKGEWKHYSRFGPRVMFKRALKDVGIPPERYSIHCARHTAATRLYEETKNLLLVQSVLGHCSPTVTAHYARIVDLGKAMEEGCGKSLYD